MERNDGLSSSNRLSGYDAEVYFLYYEEYDWAEMVKRAGFKIYYQPESYLLHKDSMSTGRNSPLKTYYLERNRLLFARRNFKGMPFWGSLLFQIFISIPKNVIQFLVKQEFTQLYAYVRGIKWNLQNKV